MERFHPSIILLFFITIITVSVFFLHPFFLLISLLTGMLYCILLKGRTAIKQIAVLIIPMMLLISIVNPLINHQGITVLFYMWNNPITLESVFYGITTAIMTGSVLTWSICLQKVLSTDMLMAVLGKPFPTLTLIFSMILSFMPRFINKAKQISIAQKGMGNEKSRIKSTLQLLSILLTWTLENGLITADSMTARGYGVFKRTNYNEFHFRLKDLLLLSLQLLLTIVFVFSMFKLIFYFFPDIYFGTISTFQIIGMIAFLLYCLIPSFLFITEAVSWRKYQLTN